MPIENSYNFRALTPQLSSSGVVVADELKQLRHESYQAVIDLLPHDNQHAVKGEADIVTAQGLAYHYIPVDWNAPTAANYQQTVAALNTCNGQKTHIHCAANWRVSGFYACFAIEMGLWSRENAKAQVLALWNPADYPQWQTLLARLGLTF